MSRRLKCNPPEGVGKVGYSLKGCAAALAHHIKVGLSRVATSCCKCKYGKNLQAHPNN